MEDQNNAVLLLEDGTVFYGKASGAPGIATGEIAFNTGMTGYQEVFSDPSYYGQLLIMNTAHIGNYGIHPDEFESEGMKISGLITKKFSDVYSRSAASKSLQQLMEENQCTGITDIDTRALVRHIRNKGAMNAAIASDGTDLETLKEILSKVPSMKGQELSSKVSTKTSYDMGDTSSEMRVALLDFGVKRSIAQCLVDRGCYVRVFPMDSSLEELESFEPDGYMLSNGPGDPGAMPASVELVQKIIQLDKPVFGICLGHQILGLSQGLQTEKMFNGHRGINHPIKNLKTGKGEITSQNHGFVLSRESVEAHPEVELTHVHLNDKSVAGIALKNKAVFSVQYHPEASAGPHDSRYLFDQFVQEMKEAKAAFAN
ncbi:MAG: carbamoyl-phosphate synthase small subunit [Bacteroidetes bacterium]|nr:MAG: carbamoyl-phosphate synthase small subunit [Bacteroidota bacterium]